MLGTLAAHPQLSLRYRCSSEHLYNSGSNKGIRSSQCLLCAFIAHPSLHMFVVFASVCSYHSFDVRYHLPIHVRDVVAMIGFRLYVMAAMVDYPCKADARSVRWSATLTI